MSDSPYKYVAKQAIFVDGVRAFQPGDPVPESSVKKHGWDDMVERAGESSSEETSSSSKKASGRGASSGS